MRKTKIPHGRNNATNPIEKYLSLLKQCIQDSIIYYFLYINYDELDFKKVIAISAITFTKNHAIDLMQIPDLILRYTFFHAICIYELFPLPRPKWYTV